MKADQDSASATVQYHIDRIPDWILSRGLAVGIVLIAFLWLYIVGTSWCVG